MEPNGGIPRDEGEKNEQHPQSERDEPTNRTYQKILRAIKAVIQKCYRSKNQEQSEKDFDHLWRVLEVVGIWGATIVGVIAVIASCTDSSRQYHALRDQIALTQAQIGPNISVSNAAVMHWDATERLDSINLTLTWKNAGQSTARGVKGWIVYGLNKGTLSETADLSKPPTPHGTIDLGNMRAGAQFPTHTISITKESIDGVRARTNDFLIAYSVTYGDVFADSNVHHLWECYSLSIWTGQNGRETMSLVRYPPTCGRND